MKLQQLLLLALLPLSAPKIIPWYSGFLINKTDCYDITEILLKVALNTMTLPHAHFLNDKITGH
jgi:hypothetical protein